MVHEIDASILRALSNPPTLAFLLIAEQQFLDVVEKSGGTSCEVQVQKFSHLSPAYQQLLKSCATRFSFRAAEFQNFSFAPENNNNNNNKKDTSSADPPQSFIGAGRVPALRYADYLPGHLYVGDILIACSTVLAGGNGDLTSGNPAVQEERFPSGRVANAKIFTIAFSESLMKLATISPHELPAGAGIPPPGTASANEVSKDNSNNTGGATTFTSTCTSTNNSPASSMHSQQQAAFAASLDLGLPLATLTHILKIELVGGVTPADALEAFRRFSGWRSMDVRWEEEERRKTGLLVFPNASDATDVLDVYEDEDSDTDVGTAVLPFKLRPLQSNVALPCTDEPALRRFRSAQWDLLYERWAGLARSPLGIKIQVQGFGVTAKLEDILSHLHACSAHFARASLLAEVTPLRKRRIILTVSTDPSQTSKSVGEIVRCALELDGHRIVNVQGKPVLRVSIAPPCRDIESRVTLVQAMDAPINVPPPPVTTSPRNADGGSMSSPPNSTTAAGAGASNSVSGAYEKQQNANNSKNVSPSNVNNNKKANHLQDADVLLPPDNSPVSSSNKKGENVSNSHNNADKKLSASAVPFTPTFGASSTSTSGLPPPPPPTPLNNNNNVTAPPSYNNKNNNNKKSPQLGSSSVPPPPPPSYSGGAAPPPPAYNNNDNNNTSSAGGKTTSPTQLSAQAPAFHLPPSPPNNAGGEKGNVTKNGSNNNNNKKK